MSSIRSATSATSVRRLTPNGAAVRLRTSAMAASVEEGSSSPRPGPRARRPRRSRRPIGDRPPSPCRSARAGSGRRPAGRTRCGAQDDARPAALRSAPRGRRSDPGSSTTRMRSSSSGVGRRASTSAGMVSSKLVAATYVLDRDARVVRAQSHRRSASRSRRRRDWRRRGGLVKARGAAARGAGAAVADAADDVDVLDERPRAVVRDPVAGRMVDRVAGRPPYADELRPWGGRRRQRRCSGCRSGRSGSPSS